MRYIYTKALAGALLLTLAGATTAYSASIVGSAHDLEVLSEGVCTYCHTPHSAPDATVPLWNRDTATTTFTMYSSVSMDATDSGIPEGVSLACLSCHDGATAYNSLAGTAVITGGDTGTMTNPLKAVGAGGTLTDDHPVSINYASADTAFVAAASGKVDVLPLYRDAGVTTGVGTQVECATCHSVHDDANGLFLRKSNSGSALCITCHTK